MAAYNLIATTTVGSGGTASINFNSIPLTYTDLQLFLSARQSTAGGTTVAMKFNGSSTGYSNKTLLAVPTGVISEQTITTYINIGFLPEEVNYTANVFSNQGIYIPNYAGSTYKSVSTDSCMENNSSTIYYGLFAGLWSNTAAITSIQLTTENGNFMQYSSASLYGIKNS